MASSGLPEQSDFKRNASCWSTATEIMQASEAPTNQLAEGRRLAELPARFGGLGLRSAAIDRASAYWASWADALEMIKQHLPRLIIGNIVTAIHVSIAGAVL